MSQLDIWFDGGPRFPRVRNTDPSSSSHAAAKIERSGIAKSQAQAVLAGYARFPLSTTAELARATGIDRAIIARRSPELATAGFLIRYEPSPDMKPCEVTGIRCVRWAPR